MAGYIGKSQGVTQVDGYNRSEADTRYVNTAGDTMTGNLVTPMVVANSALSNRNLIINGAMQVAQRGTSFTNPTANQYMVDRWFMGGNPTNLTVTQQSNVTVNGTISKTMRLDASGVSNFDVYQAIEAWEYLSNKTVTMSFWYRTNIDGVVLRQYNTATRDTLPTTNGSWQYRAVTFSIGALQADPRGAGAATLGFWNNTAPVVSGSYFEVTQVQLEVGDTATPFEHRSFGQELALCQRYFCKTYNYETVPGTATTVGQLFNSMDATQTYGYTGQFTFPVTMRATPSIIIYNPNNGTAGQLAADSANLSATTNAQGTGRVAIGVSNISIGTSVYVRAHATADAEL